MCLDEIRKRRQKRQGAKEVRFQGIRDAENRHQNVKLI
jgi:hypothetical protein